MNLTFLQNEWVLALCWTLIHSIWQGLLLAAVTGIVLASTRRSHPRKRYAMLTGLFFLFIAGAVITFCRELGLSTSAAPAITTVDLTAQEVPANSISNAVVGTELPAQTLLQRFVDYFNTHAALIVTIWFIIFIAKFLKLSTNLVYVQRLRSYKVFEPADEWKEKVQELVRKLGIHKKIRLVESGIVKVPVTMGMLKPLILLPVGLLSHLPADEIEAILLHELAHIQRRDYFVNLLQSLAETVFFFNPALLWLSSMIREERENCCDDLAISVTNNKTNFINALISFQEYHLSTPAYGMAFPGKKNQLLNRVKRIISDRNKTLNAAEKSVLSFGVALFILFTFVAAKNAPLQQDLVPKKGTAKPAAQSPSRKTAAPPKTAPAKKPADVELSHELTEHSSLDHNQSHLETLSADLASLHELDKLEAIHDSHDTIIHEYKSFSSNIHDDGDNRTMSFTVTTKDGRELKFTRVNGKVKELVVNGKTIPEAEYGKYEEELNTIENIYKRKQEDSKERRERERTKRIMGMEERRQAMADKIKNQQTHRLLESEKRKLLLEERKAHQKDSEDKMRSDRKSELQMRIREKQKADNEIRLIREKERLLKKMSIDKSFTYHSPELKLQPDVSLNMKPVRLKLKDIELKPSDIEMKPLRLEKDSAGNIKWKSVPLKLKMSPDSAKQPRNPDAPSIAKQERIRVLQAEDNARSKAAATVIRNIVDELAGENIKVDLDKSWFALDKQHFVVDGNKLSHELHDRFYSKYVTKAGGWYFGDVKVSGRGIFLDNKDVR